MANMKINIEIYEQIFGEICIYWILRAIQLRYLTWFIAKWRWRHWLKSDSFNVQYPSKWVHNLACLYNRNGTYGNVMYVLGADWIYGQASRDIYTWFVGNWSKEYWLRSDFLDLWYLLCWVHNCPVIVTNLYTNWYGKDLIKFYS